MEVYASIVRLDFGAEEVKNTLACLIRCHPQEVLTIQIASVIPDILVQMEEHVSHAQQTLSVREVKKITTALHTQALHN
jgi:hypothetical protein